MCTHQGKTARKTCKMHDVCKPARANGWRGPEHALYSEKGYRALVPSTAECRSTACTLCLCAKFSQTAMLTGGSCQAMLHRRSINATRTPLHEEKEMRRYTALLPFPLTGLPLFGVWRKISLAHADSRRCRICGLGSALDDQERRLDDSGSCFVDWLCRRRTPLEDMKHHVDGRSKVRTTKSRHESLRGSGATRHSIHQDCLFRTLMKGTRCSCWWNSSGTWQAYAS